jgi:hypothetical protein
MAGTRFRRVRAREVRLKNPFSLLILRVRTFRNAGSRDHGHHKIAKRSLAWRERSEGKKVPARGQYSDTLLDRGHLGTGMMTTACSS